VDRADSDLQDLIDVGEDILDEMMELRRDIKPIIWLAWIYLIILVVAVIAVVLAVLAAAGSSS